MRIAVFSDTHGRTDGMLRAIAAERPDAIFHLGDCERDLRPVREAFPSLTIYSVSGNCDFDPLEPETAYFTLRDVKILATHGHRYGVKQSLDSLMNTAYFADAKLVLFGHTHIPHNRDELGIRFLNPGTAGMSSQCTYGLVQLETGFVAACAVKSIPKEPRS